MAQITITHTHADGTLIEGSRRGDGVYEILLGLRGRGQGNWRYFRSLGQIGLGNSRDTAASEWRIERAAEALRAAGHDVTVEIDNSQRRTFAEAEADRYARAEARADYHEEHAGKAAASSEAAYAGSRRILDGIPFGQPVLVGHHSEGRHRRDLARADAGMRRSVEEAGRSEYHADRAEAAQRFQARRESVPATLRRIEKLEAEGRLISRRLAGEGTISGRPAEGAYRERLLTLQRDLHEELTYWREHIKTREAAGVKVWGPSDFAKGDFVFFIGSWYEVLRVNAKSLTIPAMISDGYVVTKANTRMTWTDTIPYHKVKNRKSAAEMAAIMAEADRREAEKAGA